jgi:hypothetical protein
MNLDHPPESSRPSLAVCDRLLPRTGSPGLGRLDLSRLTKCLATLVAVALVAVSCSHGISRVQTRSLPAPNPTSYSFPFPLEELRAKAWQAFSMEHQIDEPIFGRARGTANREEILSAECATDAVFGKDIFRDPANAHDLYLHTFHRPFVLSSVYRGPEGGLPFIATFHLHLTTDGAGTTVNVAASETEVVNGTKFGVGPCGPGQGWNYERVSPTTVEEYSILKYLGGYLGITNMPAVILPAQ